MNKKLNVNINSVYVNTNGKNVDINAKNAYTFEQSKGKESIVKKSKV